MTKCGHALKILRCGSAEWPKLPSRRVWQITRPLCLRLGRFPQIFASPDWLVFASFLLYPPFLITPWTCSCSRSLSPSSRRCAPAPFVARTSGSDHRSISPGYTSRGFHGREELTRIIPAKGHAGRHMTVLHQKEFSSLPLRRSAVLAFPVARLQGTPRCGIFPHLDLPHA